MSSFYWVFLWACAARSWLANRPSERVVAVEQTLTGCIAHADNVAALYLVQEFDKAIVLKFFIVFDAMASKAIVAQLCIAFF